MDLWVVASAAVIVAGIAYSYWKQFSFSLVACAVCGLVFVLMLVSDVKPELAFMPHDLVTPDKGYTLLTSMFSHASFFHLFFNVLGLAFIGTVFEERVGPRAFIVLFLLSGLCGTLMFAALRWNEPYVAVVGASGAISGVLGAFARLYPNERMTMLLFFMPLPAMPIWVIAALFIGLQFVFVSGETNVAWEAHIGGLLGGIFLAPLVVKTPLHRRTKRMVSQSALRGLATTPELKAMLRRIEDEEIADVRSAWVEQFLSQARCPTCGSRLRATKESVLCEKGHLI